MTTITVAQPIVKLVIRTSHGPDLILPVSVGGGRGLPGKSAYQSWIDSGNTGTEADFIASFSGGGALVAWTDITNKPSVLTETTASYTVAEQTKLAAIAAGATLNSPDATLLARANHTGTQAIATVTGLQAALDGKSANGHGHPSTDLTDSTVPGRALLTAATAADQRDALQTPSLGVSIALMVGQPQF